MKFAPTFFQSVLSIFVTVLILCSCSQTQKLSIEEQANKIAQNSIIIDSHIDLPNWLFENFDDVSKLENASNFDYLKAKKGGLDAPFLAVYVSPELEGKVEAMENANHQLDLLDQLFEKNADKLAKALSPADVIINFKNKVMAIPLGLENGAPLMGDLNNLKYFYDRGIRYVTIVHGKCNHICDSSYDSIRIWNGLSEFGEQLVNEMNKIGMIIDVSHASDSSFYEIMRVSKAPVAATHSGVRFYTPGFERNLTDEMIRMIAEKGGVIGIPFGSGFLRPDANIYRDKYHLAFDEFLHNTGVNYKSEEAETFNRDYYKKYPYPYASIDELIDHIDYVVKLVGIDHVGIGSDFEGVGDSLPEGLKDVSGYPNLIVGLVKRGYSAEEVDKILGLNFLNFWQRVIDHASQNKI